jgi:hypothetical protein
MNKGQVMIELSVIEKKIQMIMNSLTGEPNNKEDLEELDKLIKDKEFYQRQLPEIREQNDN